MPKIHSVVVIGAGQAGLSVSHQLTTLGVDHVVLERGRVGETWRGRWDSFCLVTPNWTMCLFLCGVHFLRKRKSSFLYPVGEDAAVVARSVVRYRSQPGK